MSRVDRFRFEKLLTCEYSSKPELKKNNPNIGRATCMFFLINLELWEMYRLQISQVGLFLKTSGLLFWEEKYFRSAKSLKMKIHTMKPLIFLHVFCVKGEV